MIDKILRNFFIKEEKNYKKNKATIISNNREIKFERDIKKISENTITELSGYFAKNNGLNLKERFYYNGI